MKIAIKNLQKKIPVNPKRIKEIAHKALTSEGIKKPGEITICFLDDKQIKELNLMYLGRNSPTDVIAFDISEDKKTILADIAISTDSTVRNSKIFRTTPLYELYLYVIHGVLHILGYDDNDAKGSKLMEKKANSILSMLKLNNKRLCIA